MTNEEIVKKVKAIIVDKLGVEPSEVTETANFTNDLGADSLDTVELLMEFERIFNIKIPAEEHYYHIFMFSPFHLFTFSSLSGSR